MIIVVGVCVLFLLSLKEISEVEELYPHNSLGLVKSDVIANRRQLACRTWENVTKCSFGLLYSLL